MPAKNSFKSLSQLSLGSIPLNYHSLPAAEQAGLKGIARLPFSLKILLENQLRHEDGQTVTKDHIQAFVDWLKESRSTCEIAYRPARVLMQDFTGVPAVVDLAALRDAMENLQGDVKQINPMCAVDLVIDHSVQVDKAGSNHAFSDNVAIEMQRNHERYQFLRWGQQAFANFRVVPPGTGICHQVNLEYLAKVAWHQDIDGEQWVYPDTLVGTDSHTTMINGLGVLGWGVGGIEAEAAMLGQAISMRIPEVIGFKFTGKLKEGITATDLVLKVVQMLRAKGVVGKFVEFYGPGLQNLPLADRATISNMAPEYGATCGLFPIDQETIRYLQLSSRDKKTVELVEAYAKAQGMWHDENSSEPIFTDTLALDLSSVVPGLAGPKRPQDHVTLSELKTTTEQIIQQAGKTDSIDQAFKTSEDFSLHHGDVMIAAITSCTNTSNPSVMLAAGLVAKKAVEKGLQIKPWVKTSLAPGSKVVTDYLEKAQLMPYLEKLGFYLVGYGCTTCIGNSGPLSEAITQTVKDNDIFACAVLSGNRNFEGRIHPLVKGNWLASPPLVVAYALAGTTRVDLSSEPVAEDKSGHPVYLRDIWPSRHEIAEAMTNVTHAQFREEYAAVFDGDAEWQQINIPAGNTYTWDNKSTYVQNPPFFTNMQPQAETPNNISGARILALLGDSITTDHISPAGAIKPDSPAGKYLQENSVAIKDFNSYGSRRGNHQVMMRGTFANIRIHNEMLPGSEGGVTKHFPSEKQMSIYDAAMQYQQDNVPLVVIAGKEYGTGSSRDWAAKGTLLLGVKAVVAESFERIHRSNLIGMGVLPLQFTGDDNRNNLQLTGEEHIDIIGIDAGMEPGMTLILRVNANDRKQQEIPVLCRIDTQEELAYYENGGILQYVLRKMQQTS